MKFLHNIIFSDHEVIFSLHTGSIRLDCLSIFNVFIHFSNVLFFKESENNNNFSRKNYVKSYSTLKLFLPIQH